MDAHSLISEDVHSNKQTNKNGTSHIIIQYLDQCAAIERRVRVINVPDRAYE